jgi:hypothetical protein
MKRRILNILIAFDQFLWVLLTLGRGYPDETISAAAWRMERAGRLAGRIMRPIIDALFWPLERQHCELSYYAELNGSQLPPEYERATNER